MKNLCIISEPVNEILKWVMSPTCELSFSINIASKDWWSKYIKNS
jgi:hypothetical protein